MKLEFRDQVIKYLKILLIIFGSIIGVVLGLFLYYQDELPPISDLRHYTMRTGSEVYDRNGKMFHMYAFEQRKMVNVNELPTYVPDALISTEDSNFYHHFGIDIIGTIRALFVDVVRADFAQGASTITQQLARNMFLNQDKKLPRKIKEALLAMRIERNFSKSEILEMYLNKVYFGSGVYGVETASMYYFNKHAKNLSLPESATLIGIIQRPNYYDPRRFPERAIARRNTVLKRMYKEKKISKVQYEENLSAPLVSSYIPMNEGAADYFLEYLRLYLEKKYGTKKLFEGGLKIYTTIDYDLTQYADSMMNRHLLKLEKSRGFWSQYSKIDHNEVNIDTKYLQGGIFSIDAQTGWVRIMIGGRNYNHNKFNRIMTAKRQPGSSYKPILYTAAIEKGYTPATIIRDEPMRFLEADGKVWEPHNFNRNEYYSYTRMREAVARSQNMWAVKTVYDIGIDPVVQMAYRFGLRTFQKKEYATALGSSEVVPYELISAYTTFCNNGVRVKPVFIDRIEDKHGKVLERGHTEKIKVCEPTVAYMMTSILQSVTDHGTAAGVKSAGYFWPAAGKTGTTDEYRDAWFIGFNRSIVTGIWVGFDNNQSTIGMTGQEACVPIWPSVMRRAILNENKGRIPARDDKRYAFEKPDGIISVKINPTTGFLARSTDNAIDEEFIDGTQPRDVADSLVYNFYPTRYRVRDKSPYIVHLPGEATAVPVGR